MMNLDKYTIKSQEVLQKAAEIVSQNQQQGIETGHILKAILVSDENVSAFLLKKLNANQSILDARLEEIIDSYPIVSGQQPYLSKEATSMLQRAEKYLKEFDDSFIAVEHLLLGILDGKIRQLYY